MNKYMILSLLIFSVGCKFSAKDGLTIEGGNRLSLDEISGIPTSGVVGNGLVTITIQDQNVEEVKSKKGPQSTTNCNSSAGYNTHSLSGMSFDLDFSGDSDGPLKVCILPKMGGSYNDVEDAISFNLLRDTVAPSSVTVTDGTYSSSTSSTGSVSWTASTDTNGILRYEYAIGSTSGGTNIVNWTSNGTSTSLTRTGLSLSSGTTYYVSVRAVDNGGNISSVGTSNGWTVDNSAPSAASSLDDGTSGSASDSPTITWAAATDNVGVSGYQISLGTSAGNHDIVDWTNISAVTTYQFTGLSLSTSTTYYVNLKAFDAAGNFSSVVSSNGFTVSSSGTATIKLWGGGGGAGFDYRSSIGCNGGSGGYVTSSVTLTPGDVLTIKVAGGGGAGGYDGSLVVGTGGSYGGGSGAIGGGGGGYSAIYSGSTLIALAAGGGGGGRSFTDNVYGGAGGGTTGANSAMGGATGGTQSAGGAGAVNGGSLSGASSSIGGGGGGGYFGGGSGGDNGPYAGSGGGGSSYVPGGGSTSQATAGTTVAPNNSDTDYVAGVAAAGVGQISTGTNGGNGLVVINWNGTTYKFYHTGSDQSWTVP